METVPAFNPDGDGYVVNAANSPQRILHSIAVHLGARLESH